MRDPKDELAEIQKERVVVSGIAQAFIDGLEDPEKRGTTVLSGNDALRLAKGYQQILGHVQVLSEGGMKLLQERPGLVQALDEAAAILLEWENQIVVNGAEGAGFPARAWREKYFQPKEVEKVGTN